MERQLCFVAIWLSKIALGLFGLFDQRSCTHGYRWVPRSIIVFIHKVLFISLVSNPSQYPVFCCFLGAFEQGCTATHKGEYVSMRHHMIPPYLVHSYQRFSVGWTLLSYRVWIGLFKQLAAWKIKYRSALSRC